MINANERECIYNGLVGISGTTLMDESLLLTPSVNNMMYVGYMWVPALCIPRPSNAGTYFTPIILPSTSLELSLVHNDTADPNYNYWSILDENGVSINDGNCVAAPDDLWLKRSKAYFIDNNAEYVFTLSPSVSSTVRNYTLRVYNPIDPMAAFTLYYRTIGDE